MNLFTMTRERLVSAQRTEFNPAPSCPTCMMGADDGPGGSHASWCPDAWRWDKHDMIAFD